MVRYFVKADWDVITFTSSLLANSHSVERCQADDLMPNVPISCLPPSSVYPEVQGLNFTVSDY